MGKIGIVTLNGYTNYGNRVQNYALQEALKKFDYDVETIWIENVNEQKADFIKLIINIIRNPKLIYNKINNKVYLNKLNKNRKERFKKFSSKYIVESDIKIGQNNLPKEYLDLFDLFVTGSDQVWNPYYTKGSPLYFLTFAPKKKRIAYAPSFGISYVPKWCKEDYKQWLNDIKHLSVREDDGSDLIEKLTGKNAEVLPDPTLLLTKEEWLTIAKPASNKPKEEYLLTYFLGPIPDKVQKLIKQITVRNNLKIVNLAQSKHMEYYLADPSEFLDFINSATIFFTDSFHGSVFSILFETPFVVTDRESKVPSMNSRINTLLSTYNLEERHISNLKQNDIFNVNFSHVEKILEQERDKANTFLNKALNS